MSRKSQTVATFAVRVILPKNVTLPMMQEYIRTSIVGWKGGMSPSEFDTLVLEAIAVVKKETTYAYGQV